MLYPYGVPPHTVTTELEGTHQIMIATSADYLAAITATRQLVREDLVESTPYHATPATSYDACDWCELEPVQPAMISLWWTRGRNERDGYATCCATLHCLHAAVRAALEESDPEQVTIEYPVLSAASLPRAA
jgi:hypothetical protein